MPGSGRSPLAEINAVFVLILTVIGVLALWQIRSILMLILASVIVVVVFTTPIRLLTRHLGLNRSIAIIASFVGFIVLFIVLVMLVFPTLFVQFEKLATVTIPAGVERLIEWWNSGQLYEQLPFLESAFQDFVITDEVINQVVSQIATALGQLGGSVVPLIGGVANSFLSFVIIIFLSLFLMAEPQRYENGIIKLTPLWYRRRISQIMARIDNTMRAWIKVTIVSMLVAGVGTGIGLALIGVNEWAALGVLTGALSFIPNFGPIAALIPAIAVGIVQVPESLGLILIIVYGVSFIQSQIVAPVLANENMNLPPVLILIGQIIFGIFFGFMGIMLAVPLTAISMVLVDEVYVRDILGDRTVEAKSKDIVEVKDPRTENV